MLVNKDKMPITSHVKFISYTGKWPNLCGGILTLEIDGRTVRFGNYGKDKTDHCRFWMSGGRCSCSSSLEHGEWITDVDELPSEFRKYAAEIDEVFNHNVEHGCCGGCR